LKLSKTPPSIRRTPPDLGQDNEGILKESGYDPGQIAALQERGVIGG
jgi:crotonobetainyl-CoA:carnitine CoA-transferase CaiB-like acyl-CoA transferase